MNNIVSIDVAPLIECSSAVTNVLPNRWGAKVNARGGRHSTGVQLGNNPMPSSGSGSRKRRIDANVLTHYIQCCNLLETTSRCRYSI